MKSLSLIAALAATALSGAAQAAGYNLDFDIPSGTGPTTFTASEANGYYGGLSAASGWSVYMNAFGTTSTELLASTDPWGGGGMLHVTTDAGSSGVYQGTGAFTYVALDVRVLSGNFTVLSAACGGSCTTAEYSIAGPTDGWQHVTFQTNFGDEIAIYSAFGATADFYVDNLYTGFEPAPAVPEPGEWAMMGLGLAITGAFARRRSSKTGA